MNLREAKTYAKQLDRLRRGRSHVVVRLPREHPLRLDPGWQGDYHVCMESDVHRYEEGGAYPVDDEGNVVQEEVL